MNRTPIQRMVDRACGLPDDWQPSPRVMLECSSCKRTKSAEVDPTDPPGTAKIVMLCPECAKGDFSMIEYFDKDGKQILPSSSGDSRE